MKKNLWLKGKRKNYMIQNCKNITQKLSKNFKELILQFKKVTKQIAAVESKESDKADRL